MEDRFLGQKRRPPESETGDTTRDTIPKGRFRWDLGREVSTTVSPETVAHRGSGRPGRLGGPSGPRVGGRPSTSLPSHSTVEGVTVEVWEGRDHPDPPPYFPDPTPTSVSRLCPKTEFRREPRVGVPQEVSVPGPLCEGREV